jgi:L-cystine uptake protein TcyP (sodium:dicarboxylate symporter family)
MASTKSSYSDRLPLWVLLGGALGVLIGAFFGDDAAVLRPIGSTYVQLMEIVVFPYIICSLLVGLGRLSPDTAIRLFRSSWLVYLVVGGQPSWSSFCCRWPFHRSRHRASSMPPRRRKAWGCSSS